MFKNLGLSSKMLFGFGLIISLLVLVSAVSWLSITSSSDSFKEYRHLARESNISSRLQAHMLMVRMNVKNFVISGSDSSKKSYADYYSKMKGYHEEAEKMISNESRSKMLDEVKSYLHDYDLYFKEIVEYREKRDSQVLGVLDVVGPQIEKYLTDIMRSANTDKDTVAAFESGIALRHLLLARLYVVKFLESNQSSHVERVKSEFESFHEELNMLDKEIQNPSRRRLLEKIKEKINEYEKAFSAVVAIIYARNEVIQDKLDVLGPKFAEEIEAIKLSAKQEQDILGPKLQEQNEIAVNLIIAVSLVATLFGVMASFLLLASIKKPLSKLFQGLKTFSTEELDKLGESFMQIIKDLSNSSSQVNSAAGQISSASQGLSQSASEQASAVEETSSSIEELSAMVKNNVDAAMTSRNISENVRSQMEELNKAMSLISDSNIRIEELVKIINEIGEKTEVIDEIVFQTKLLSFNASVEAERAGEHGRGFAVVAQEVGNLAQMSGNAAKEIAEIVKKSISEAEIIAKENNSRVGRGSEIVVDVLAKVESVAQSTSQIYSASNDQAGGIEQIAKAIENINSATQESASISEESASSAEELESQADSLSGLVSALNSFLTGDSVSKSEAVVHDIKKFQTRKLVPVNENNSYKVASGQDFAGVDTHDMDENWEKL